MSDISLDTKAVAFDGTAGKLLTVSALAAGADWLFFGRDLGLSVIVFLALAIAGSALTNREVRNVRQLFESLGVFTLGLLPLAYSCTLVSCGFAVAGTAVASQMIATPRTSPLQLLLDSTRPFSGIVWRAIPDLVRLSKYHSAIAGNLRSNIAAWVVPLALGGIFVSLFASANPLIERWLTAINWRLFSENLSLSRTLFWLTAAAVVWPFIFLHRRTMTKVPRSAAAPEGATADARTSVLFGKLAILRSLILFNFLFAIQTALDTAYLWGGLELPDGTTYAAYAQRGAYPLIVTALLAAAFVLVATRPGSETESSPRVRALVYLWIAQNILLVISSLLRLSMYVEVYSLTYWRVAAFVWMLLVAAGLVLIVARLFLHRTSQWLVAANAASAAAVLYACCFINFPLLIANYNVTHSREVSGTGVPLDIHYIHSLGPHAIPAIDRYVIFRQDPKQNWLPQAATGLSFQHIGKMRDWRAWSYADWQLLRYLRGRQEAIRIAGPR